MTITSQPAPKLKLRPRRQLGLGAAWIGKEEEELVLQVLRNQEPFRYYGHDPAHRRELHRAGCRLHRRGGKTGAWGIDRTLTSQFARGATWR
jgi:hypothetical protein